jgi:hypothetical protein
VFTYFYAFFAKHWQACQNFFIKYPEILSEYFGDDDDDDDD